MIGRTVSHYQIGEELGRGGMGIVYRAEDSILKRTVALKFLMPQAIGNADEKERFTREAQAAAALTHPNIATVFEIGDEGGQRFIAMEYIDGKSLKEIIEGGPLKLADAVDIAIQISEGLQGAHEKGVVHRDLKAANVMVVDSGRSGAGRVKIMDFGLAKLKGVSLLTKQGTTLGTVAYMSPEQARGEKVDHRTDIWSLGVVLYEMIAGRLPFRGDFDQATVYAILNSNPDPLTSVRTNVPTELERIVAKMLAKDPEERYQSIREIPVDLRAVRSVLKGSSSSATMVSKLSQPSSSIPLPAISVRRSILPWVVAGVMGCSTLLVLWRPWRQAEPPPVVMKFALPISKSEPLQLLSYPALAISPDGTRFVFRAGGRLYVRALDNPEPVALAGTEEGNSPCFSPDGRWIAFFSGGKLKKIPVGGGAPVALVSSIEPSISLGDNRGVTWGSKGTLVFAPIATTGLWAIPEEGGPPRRLTVIDTVHRERTHRWPAFLPDGKTVLFTVGIMDHPDYYEGATIAAVDIETGVRNGVMEGASTARYLQTGHLVFSRGGVLYAMAFDPASLHVHGSPIPLVEGVAGDPTTGAMHCAISENGTLAYAPGQIEGAERSLVLLDHAGQETVLDAAAQPYIEPRIAPDGKRLAVVVASGGDFDIWIYDLQRKTLSRLTFGGTNRSPAWSPDSKRIAYWSNGRGEGTEADAQKAGIYLKQADGSGEPEQILGGMGRAYIDSWSRDGSVLMLDRPTVAGQSDIIVLPLSGDRKPFTFLASQFDEYQSTLSPDGKWVAYVSNESGIYQVYVQPLRGHGGKWQISSDGGNEPHWSRDGRSLYYWNSSKMYVVSVTTGATFGASQPKVVLDSFSNLPVDSGISYDITPDDRYFVTTRPKNKEVYQQINLVVNWFSDVKTRIGATR